MSMVAHIKITCIDVYVVVKIKTTIYLTWRETIENADIAIL